MGILKNIYEKEITKKFFWTTVFIVIIFFLRILDIVTTLVALNIGYGLQEANQLAFFFVDNPKIWLYNNIAVIIILSIINIVLWILDHKTEKTVDKVTFLFDVILFVVMIVCIYIVINNMLILYNVLGI